MARTAFQNLVVYPLSERLPQEVWQVARHRTALDRDTSGKQLVLAADSVGANIAEGFGRGTGADNKRFVRIARGSVYEVKHRLRLAFARGLVPVAQVDALKPLLDELGPRLNAYLNTIGSAQTNSTIHSPRSAFATLSPGKRHGYHSN